METPENDPRRTELANRGNKKTMEQPIRNDIFENISDSEEFEDFETRKKSRKDLCKEIREGCSVSPVKAGPPETRSSEK